MQIKNPVYANADETNIDLEIEHPDYGWIPFTATEDDVEEHGRDLYAQAKAGDFGPVAPYVEPPEPEPQVPSSVSRRQARLALLDAGKLDEVEQAVEQGGRAAEIEYDADTWSRDNAFLQQLWSDLGGTESELDDLFIAAAQK